MNKIIIGVIAFCIICFLIISFMMHFEKFLLSSQDRMEKTAIVANIGQ